MRVRSVFSAGLFFARLSMDLFLVWLTLDWEVRKARRAFEKQLVLQGMAKKDAKRLSSQYSRLKNDLMGLLKNGMTPDRHVASSIVAASPEARRRGT